MLRRSRIAPFVLLPLLATCEPSGDEGGGVGRGVIVIAIDGLRADHTSLYGYDRPTTPSLDLLAADGVHFRQAFSSAPLLLPSHFGLMTGCDPTIARRLHLTDELEASAEERWLVPDNIPHLAVEMLVEGFATGAFIDDESLSKKFGFGPGFQRYLVPESGDTEDSDALGVEGVSDRFLKWMKSLNHTKPFFAYLHLHDLERIWQSPDPRWESYFSRRPDLDLVPPVGSTDDVFFAIPRSRWRGGSRPLGYYEALYDGHLRRLDDKLGDLFQNLRIQGRFDNTTIVVVGTHGMQIGEAGLYLTSGLYSVADVQVPWILRTPILSSDRRGQRIEGVASLLDLAPTLLEIIRAPSPSGMHGVSQLAAVVGEQAQSPREFAFATCGLQGGGAVMGPRWTLELARFVDARRGRSWFGTDEMPDGERWVFYDREVTPYPPLFGHQEMPSDDLAERMRAAGALWDHNLGRARKILQGGTLFFDPSDPETIEELRALGYLRDEP